MRVEWQRVTGYPAVDVASLGRPRSSPPASAILTVADVIAHVGATLDACQHLELEVREAAVAALLDELREIRAAGRTFFAEELEPAPVAAADRNVAASVLRDGNFERTPPTRRPQGRPLSGKRRTRAN